MNIGAQTKEKNPLGIYQPRTFVDERAGFMDENICLEVLASQPQWLGYSARFASNKVRRSGSGGESVNIAVLRKNGRKILLSVKYSLFKTSADSSLEYTLDSSSRTYLIAEDECAREIIGKLRRENEPRKQN